jgi:2,3-diketo-5-methylthio-1-phosphopentane phosphatase
MRIICDFDGTISRRDTTDLVLETLAGPGWTELEDEWLATRITAAECMRGQVALIGGDREALDAVLDSVELDPGFVDFVAWCEARALPVSIVSDGVDYFIGRILARHGLERLPVISNELAGEPGAWALEQPWAEAGCAAGSGVCKCAATGLRGRTRVPPATTVYVGDGRSDFCIAGRADILFAKDKLADYAAARAQPYHPFETFHDVTATLAALMGESAAEAALAAARAAAAR